MQYNKIPFVKKDYDSTRIYRNTQKKRVRHRLMTHPPILDDDYHRLFHFIR